MSCPCDEFNFPKQRAIAAGLAAAFRPAHNLGRFPDWREALLQSVGQQAALGNWRARDPLDYGLMLMEMGAYLFDSLSFYDDLVAGESYIQTAALAATPRRLVDLLGYRPRPASAALVKLAAEADGKLSVKLARGTAFRSGEFDGNPPQVFELDADTAIDPRLNRLAVAEVAESGLPASLSRFLATPGSVALRVGDAVVLEIKDSLYARRVIALQRLVLRSGAAFTEVVLDNALSPPANSSWEDVRVLKPGARTGLWQLNTLEGAAASNTQWSLQARLPIRAKQIVLLEQGNQLEAQRIDSTGEQQRTVVPSLSSQVQDENGDEVGSVVSPAIKAPVTRLTFATASVISADPAKAILHHALYPAANVVPPVKLLQDQGDPLVLSALRDPPRVAVAALLLRDAHEDAVFGNGSLDPAAKTAVIDQSPAWGKTLTPPVELFANVLSASRGESVRGEILGYGDGAQSKQQFKLAKKPLTYLTAANAGGLLSSLSVRVDGVLWREVGSFYAVAVDAQVYTVRQDEAGDSWVSFGSAARLSTGAVVSADYRFGAGAAGPPANSVKQLAKPVVGLKRVFNPLPAYGGGDAEAADEIVYYAPRSALLLGRAISLTDLEAAAAQVAGVRAAKTGWRWDAGGLRPAAVVSFIGDAQLIPSIVARLRELAEPDAPIRVEQALPQVAVLDVDLAVDAAYVAADVALAVTEALYAAPNPIGGGPLRPERLGPDGVVFLSRMAAVVMAVPGVAGIRSVSFDQTPFDDVARKPMTGYYFDFGDSGVAVHGAVAS